MLLSAYFAKCIYWWSIRSPHFYEPWQRISWSADEWGEACYVVPIDCTLETLIWTKDLEILLASFLNLFVFQLSMFLHVSCLLCYSKTYPKTAFLVVDWTYIPHIFFALRSDNSSRNSQICKHALYSFQAFWKLLRKQGFIYIHWVP